MPEDFFVLSEDDVEKLREVIRRVLQDEFGLRTLDEAEHRRKPQFVEGILDATLTAGDTTGVLLSKYGTGYDATAWTDTTDNVTVKWPAGTIGPQIDAGTWVFAVWHNGQWRPIAADC